MKHARRHTWRLIACSVAPPSLAKSPAPATSSTSGSMLPAGSKAGDCTVTGHDYGSTRYSELDKITTSNVAQLEESWNYTTGIADGHDGLPLVVGGRMYIVTPYPDKLVAFDLSKLGPAKLWEYAPPIDPTRTKAGGALHVFTLP